MGETDSMKRPPLTRRQKERVTTASRFVYRLELVLDFDAMPGSMHTEQRLSRMTRWVLDAEQRAVPYALRIGTLRIPPSVGAAHSAACLRALALYGHPEASA